jgi:hypothetical protein
MRPRAIAKLRSGSKSLTWISLAKMDIKKVHKFRRGDSGHPEQVLYRLTILAMAVGANLTPASGFQFFGATFSYRKPIK